MAPLLLLLALGGAPSEPPGPDTLPDPFAGVETWTLENGLKVWYARLPGAPNVTASVSVPYGRDRDPPGKEELAHFTEHMLFSDHRGRSEEEIAREIEDRGGRRNGLTTADQTFYYVTIGREHGLFAVEWLHGIVSPHAMEPDVVERNRRPVALEIGARPPELFDLVHDHFLDPAPLRLPGFWEREFGLRTRRSRQVDRWRSLRAITPEDLREFYERYYAPSRMTLTVTGDVDPDSLRRVVEETYATLPERPAPDARRELRDPRRFRRAVYWTFRPHVRYTDRYKVYRPSGEEHLDLIVLEHLLERRLTRKLRFGDWKAVYGIRVTPDRRGPALAFEIDARIRPGAFDSARAVIAAELDTLRRGALPDSVFRAERDALARTMRTRYAGAEPLNFLVFRYFYDRDLHRDLPDLARRFETLTAEDVARTVERHVVRERRVVRILRTQPLGQGAVAALAVIVVLLAVAAGRKLLLRPAPLRRIRYVARLRLASPWGALALGAFAAAVAVAGRLLAFGAEWSVDRFLVGIDSYPVRMAGYASLGVVAVLYVIVALSRLPRKLLVFDDHLRIKYLSYRSRIVAPGEVEEASLLRLPDVLLSRRILGCVPLASGLVRPGVYLRIRGGPAYFFSTRDPEEALAAIREVSEPGPVG